jgi:hypothetical protein
MHAHGENSGKVRLFPVSYEIGLMLWMLDSAAFCGLKLEIILSLFTVN